MSDTLRPRHGGQILVDQLGIQGCDTVFCVPGESYLAALDGLHAHNAIQTVVCRQEGGATMMADALRQKDWQGWRCLCHPWPRRYQRCVWGACGIPGLDPDDPVHRPS